MQVKFPDGMNENDVNESNYFKVSIKSNNHTYKKIDKENYNKDLFNLVKDYQKYLNNNESEKCQAIEDEIERQLIDSTNLKNRHTKCMPNSCFKDHLLKCRFNFPRFIQEFLSFCLT